MGSKAYAAGDMGRRAERVALDESTRLKPNSWSSLEIRMLDLSPLGFRAECEARLQPGGGVTLEIPGLGAVDAQVEWQRDNQFGARFFSEVDLAACEWMLGEKPNPLAQLLRSTGFNVAHTEYFNLAGVPGWWLAGRVLRRPMIPAGSLKLYDVLVPLFRLERLLPWRVGQSLIAIGEAAA